MCEQQAESTQGEQREAQQELLGAGQWVGVSLWNSGRRQRWNKQLTKVPETWKQGAGLHPEAGLHLGN